MSKFHALVLTVSALLGSAQIATAEEPGRLTFPAAGFSIVALEPSSPDAPYQALMMFLRATDGFAPNVNVQLQAFPGSITEYTIATETELAQAGLTLLKADSEGPSAASYEYAGALNNNRLHWYARALKRGNTVYLVTATATESQWLLLSARLMECVDSFRLE